MKPTPLYTLALTLAALIVPAVLLDAAPPATRPAPAPAPPAEVAPNDTNYATVLTIHDGDTLRVRIEQGFSGQTRQWVRLLDVFAPELGEAGGPEARDAMAAVVKPGDVVVVRCGRVKGHLRDAEFRRTLGRYVAEVWFYDRAGGQVSLNGYMRAVVGKPKGKGVK